MDLRSQSMALRKSRSRLCLLLLGTVSLVSVSGLAQTFYYVAPAGNDAWSGRLARPDADLSDGPLASLTAARDRIRVLKSGGPLAKPVRVIVSAFSGRVEDAAQAVTRQGGTILDRFDSIGAVTTVVQADQLLKPNMAETIPSPR